MPILQDKLSKLENNYLDMKENMEFEQSVFNEWELESQRQQQLIKDIEVSVTILHLSFVFTIFYELSGAPEYKMQLQ